MMMLYKNTEVKVRSLDGDIDYFDIVAGVLQGDTLSSYLFIICLDYMLRTSIDKMKDNSFKLGKERSRSYPTQTITDADYADDIAILVNTPTQAETLLHSLKRAATDIGLHVNADKAWTAIDRLSVIWKSDLTNKIKHIFFPSSKHVNTAIWMHYMDAN